MGEVEDAYEAIKRAEIEKHWNVPGADKKVDEAVRVYKKAVLKRAHQADGDTKRGKKRGW